VHGNADRHAALDDAIACGAQANLQGR
jgi:hypothetical protein